MYGQIEQREERIFQKSTLRVFGIWVLVCFIVMSIFPRDKETEFVGLFLI